MNEMYDMSIVAHYYSVMGILGVVLLHLLMIVKASNIEKYKRFNRIFNPIGSIFLGSVIYTGVIMMAAKHLDFTAENIAMILFSLALIYLEVKRSSKLKYIKSEDNTLFLEYKTYVYKILSLEVLVTVSISVWMLI